MATDPKYLRLYHEYSKAIRGFDNALRDRQRVRRQLSARRNMQPQVRRPVGSPANYRIPQSSPTRSPATKKPRERRIYLGDILGWAKIVYTSPDTQKKDPSIDLDESKLYDTTSQHLYWNAKNHYKKCKRAFFDYARRQNIDLHKQRAAQEASHVANLQLLGADDGEADFEGIRREVEAACRNALALYRTAPKPKTDEMKIILLENLADAQLVGLETPVVHSMTVEMNMLLSAGSVKIDGPAYAR